MLKFKENAFLFLILIFLLIEGIFFVTGTIENNKEYQLEKNKLIELKNILDRTEIEAETLAIYDATLGKEIYTRNNQMIKPIASLTKIMTVLVALEDKRDQEVLISSEAVARKGDSGFLVGEKFKKADLIKAVLIGSINDGAFALTEGRENFLEKMNLKAKKIGMENSSFLNPSGLDLDIGKAGALGTASDINILANYALKSYPEIFKDTIKSEMIFESNLGLKHFVQNTNTYLEKMPDILFSKTGYTLTAGGTFTFAFKNRKNHLIFVTLLGSSQEGRFNDALKIKEIIQNRY